MLKVSRIQQIHLLSIYLSVVEILHFSIELWNEYLLQVDLSPEKKMTLLNKYLILNLCKPRISYVARSVDGRSFTPTGCNLQLKLQTLRWIRSKKRDTEGRSIASHKFYLQ